MRRFARFLKDMFIAPGPQWHPATSSEMTVHDGPPNWSGRMRTEHNPALTRTALQHVDACWYGSESDLHGQWRHLEDAPRQTAYRTVILVLGDFLWSNLRELIRQRRSAHRLVIVPHAGHWPGTDSFGDLALASGSLGWRSVELCRDLHDALENSAPVSGQAERLLLVLPAHTAARSLM